MLLHVFTTVSIKKDLTKGVIRSRKSKDIQYNGQKKKDKSTNNDVQNITQKLKISSTNPLKRS